MPIVWVIRRRCSERRGIRGWQIVVIQNREWRLRRRRRSATNKKLRSISSASLKERTVQAWLVCGGFAKVKCCKQIFNRKNICWRFSCDITLCNYLGWRVSLILQTRRTKVRITAHLFVVHSRLPRSINTRVLEAMTCAPSTRPIDITSSLGSLAIHTRTLRSLQCGPNTCLLYLHRMNDSLGCVCCGMVLDKCCGN
jgi:hypothetical protein